MRHRIQKKSTSPRTMRTEDVKGAPVAANIPPDVKTVWNVRASGDHGHEVDGGGGGHLSVASGEWK